MPAAVLVADQDAVAGKAGEAGDEKVTRARHRLLGQEEASTGSARTNAGSAGRRAIGPVTAHQGPRRSRQMSWQQPNNRRLCWS